MAKKRASSGSSGRPKKKRKKRPPHLCELGEFDGVLSRNATYKKDARNGLKGTGIYDNEVAIRTGVMKQRSVTLTTPEKEIQEKIKKYKYDYRNTDMISKPINFGPDYAGRPYYHQAHHILVCELFYNDDDIWDAEHLNVLLQVGYNINNDRNIIYLPNSSANKSISCFYHNLPNHGLGHSRYSNEVTKYTKKVYDKIDKALDEGDCEKKDDILDELWELLTKIEDTFWDYIIRRGTKQLG